MTYSTPPLVATGDVWTANLHNVNLRDNCNATAPGVFTAKGQLFIGSGAAAAALLSPGSNGQLVASDSGQATGRKSANSGLVPIGGIVIWSGSLVSIPAGWQLCDGSGGTPNLQDKFIVGSGSTYSSGDSGGAASANLQHSHTLTSPTTSSYLHAHTNSATSTDGAHAHGVGTAGQPSGTDRPLTPTAPPTVARGVIGGGHTHTVSGTTASDGAHSHSVPDTSDSTSHSHTITGLGTANGLSTTQSLLPPYYALAYIMRMS